MLNNQMKPMENKPKDNKKYIRKKTEEIIGLQS